jgi:tRNA A37 methylthiotransferase MiaB
MGKTFDIGLERLTGGSEFPISSSISIKNEGGCESVGADVSPLGAIRSTSHGTFFLETFGCQMNDHDSEKVAGVLLSRGYRQVESPESASLILYNTCSIREKAAQKIFSRLGEFGLNQNESRIIGVLGCVAQQEGEEIFKRAPWVSLVCGSASYSKLPELLEIGRAHV